MNVVIFISSCLGLGDDICVIVIFCKSIVEINCNYIINICIIRYFCIGRISIFFVFYCSICWEISENRLGIVYNSNGLNLYYYIVSIVSSCLGMFEGVGVFIFVYYNFVFVFWCRGGIVVWDYRGFGIGWVSVFFIFYFGIYWEVGEFGVGGVLYGDDLYVIVVVFCVIYYVLGLFDGV